MNLEKNFQTFVIGRRCGSDWRCGRLCGGFCGGRFCRCRSRRYDWPCSRFWCRSKRDWVKYF